MIVTVYSARKDQIIWTGPILELLDANREDIDEFSRRRILNDLSESGQSYISEGLYVDAVRGDA